MKKFFSIITATYNAAATLPRLLESLACQTCRDFALIIQDGMSDDTSIAIAKSFASRLPELYLTSEKDSGIYDAWNKALENNSQHLGEWIIFLGADDLLASCDVLAEVYKRLKNCPASLKYACGDIEFFSEDGKERRIRNADAENAYGFFPLGMSFAHSALFHRKCVFFNNRFDPSYKIVGDYDFLIRTWTEKNAGMNLGVLVTRMSTGGCSNNAANAKLLKDEVDRIRARYFPIRQLFFKIGEHFDPLRSFLRAIIGKTAVARALFDRMRMWKRWFFYQR